jgi:hypothetical protein
MSLSLGIVGLPNVGKSTLFNALLKKQVALAANYPFATIEPNVGTVAVPDSRLPQLADVLEKTTKKRPPEVPAIVKFVDIAGLVAGASKGEGLGNQFLSHIRETDAICHVLRVFEDDDVLRSGSVDPVSDYKTVETELQLADFSTISKQAEPKGTTSKEEKFKWSVVEKLRFGLNSGISARDVLSSPEEREIARQMGLMTAKKQLFVLNVSEGDLAADKAKTIIEKAAKELAELSAGDQKVYLAELGVTQSGLERLIQIGYTTLGLQSFYTAGDIEVRAWTVQSGSPAPKAAKVIHTDFEKKFISAHIVGFDDFITCDGWKGAKELGKMRMEGRDYIMQPDDVVEFMIGS